MRELQASSRLSAALLVLVFSACQPELEHTEPTPVVTAVFDPTTSRIPLPNDLVFLSPNPNGVCPPPANMQTGGPACAQAELLANFAGQFPNDQEVAITIEFTQTNFSSNGQQTLIAPDLDLTSFKSTTFFVARLTATGVVEVPIEPLTAADYVKSTAHGTLTIHNQGRAPWAPGTYAVLVRGGPEGIKTTSGTPVYASQVFALIAQGLDLTDRANLGLLRAQTGSFEEAEAQGRQLNALIGLYKASAFPAAQTRFPPTELAIATTFRINANTNVTVDAARGIVPLPIDLLRDPVKGTLTPLAACTLAGSRLASDGTCPNPAAGGFQALDGFSTTGAILAQTSDLVLAATITPTTVQLFDLSNPAQPMRVNPADLIVEPCEFTVNPANGMPGCGVPAAVAPVIALQPAGATAGDATSVFRSKPLKDRTDYAVVITTDILDRNGRSIGPGTVASVLRLSNPIVVGGKSALLGVDDATAAALDKMRLQLQPVFATLAAGGIPSSKVAMAYTFRTQTILGQANQLAALPYARTQTDAAAALPIGPLVQHTPAEAFGKFGVDQAVVPSAAIDQILEVEMDTFNALDPITGAFMPNPAVATKERIKVLIATPLAAAVPACAGPLAPLGKCAPLMVFRHGLGSGRAAMLTVANTFAARGMVTVAIDAAKHGDRSFCTSGTTGAASGCVGGAACTTLLPSGAQGDVNPPGSCGAAGFIKRPVSATCGTNPSPCPAFTDGVPAVSSNYLITTNFFRTRDTFRQDLIDQSHLVQVLAFVPSGPPPAAHVVASHLFTRAIGQTGAGLIIDPGKVYYTGQSLGAIQGAMDVATNPRISKAALNVGGGTIVDLFTNSPAFAAQTDALLAQLGIQRGTSRFLQFLVVTKTVLDPADPVNFIGHLTANPLPDLLKNPNGTVLQDTKKVLTQIANCDGVVPNPFSLIQASNAYAGNTPVVPLPSGPAFFAPNLEGAFQLFVGAGFHPVNTPFGTCTVPAAFVGHAFLTDWAVPTRTANAQADIADFVMTDNLPLSVRQ